jgi:hypothetical protein
MNHFAGLHPSQIQMSIVKMWECSVYCRDVSAEKLCSKREENQPSHHGSATGYSCGPPTLFIIHQSLSKGKYLCICWKCSRATYILAWLLYSGLDFQVKLRIFIPLHQEDIPTPAAWDCSLAFVVFLTWEVQEIRPLTSLFIKTAACSTRRERPPFWSLKKCFVYTRSCLLYVCVCVCKVRAVLCSVLRKSDQNVIPRSLFYLGMTGPELWMWVAL